MQTQIYLGAFVLFLVAVLGFVGVIGVDAVRRRRALMLADGGPNDECAACGSADIAHPLPDVYICGACGHEGGEGLPALERQRWREKVAGWSAEERRTKGLANLDEGRRLVLAAEGPLDAARAALEAARRAAKAEQRAGFIAQATAANADAVEDLYSAYGLLRDATWLLTEAETDVALPDGAMNTAPEHDWAVLSALRATLAAVAARAEAAAG